MTYDQKFADKVRVWCMGGNGGNGCVSHLRENYGFKLPDGGSGGQDNLGTIARALNV